MTNKLSNGDTAVNGCSEAKLRLTPAGKVTKLLSTFISLEMGERSEAKSV